MANEKFKVKFGLAVGDTSATIDGTNGDISTLGDVDVKGGNITNSTGALDIAATGGGNLSFSPASPGQTVVNSALDVNGNITGDLLQIDNIQIDSNTVSATTGALTLATTAGSNNIVIDPSSGTTVNDGHLILGQLNTAAILTTNGTGGLSIRTGSHPTSANIGLTDGVNGDITIDTDGSGKFIINATTDINGALDVNGNITGDLLNIDNIQIDGTTITTVGANNLLLNTNNGTNSGQIQITQGLNGNISIEPSGTGYIQAGAANTSTTVTTSGTGNLTLNTNFGTNAGSITLANGAFTSTGSSISGTTLTIGTLVSGTIGVGQSIHGGTVLTNTVITANISGTGSGSTWTVSKSQTVASSSLTGAGNITLAPNTTGDIALTLNNGGNLINSRNYVLGEIRNATTEAAGEVWTFGPAGTGFKGITLDNSADTADGPATVLRSFTGGAVAGAGTRGRVIFERARGTSASPTAIQSGDFLGTVEGTGYTSTGWSADTLAVQPCVFNFTAAENWISNTNLGTSAALILAPTATTISTGANLVTVMAVNPQTFACRSDSYTWSNGKTGTTQRMSLDVSGNLIVSGDVRINGNDIQGSGGLTAITMTSANTLTTVTSDEFKVNNAAGTNYFQIYKDGSNHIAASVNQTRATTGDEFALMNFTTQRSTDGINYTPTQLNDVIGSFKFNGNANTSTSPGVPAGPGAQITATATENWTASANGTRINFSVIKNAAITDVNVISAASDTTTFKSDSYTLESSAGTDYLVMNGTSNTFYQPVGFPVYTVAAAGAITGAVGQQIAISNSSTSPSQSDDGMMAYWATNGTPQWRYIHNNGAL